jgi:ABC-type bacteriocin/lantibiotic exporter with double-glycine peptidase domain
MNKVFTTTYDIFNRKLFSLPKVMLLPQIFALQPQILFQAFPFIFLSDWIKANANSYMTNMIENIQKELIELNGIQAKVEAFDLKNAELLQRSGRQATSFTHGKWDNLSQQVQARNAVADILTRSKEFFSFMQHHFVFVILIDCALADMIAVGKMIPSEIFVFSRAIEDAVDLILIRSRSEAELARMKTEIGKLELFHGVLQTNEAPRLLPCSVEGTRSLVLRNLHYSRGSANARADHVELTPGVYALTGANGSGKSVRTSIDHECASALMKTLTQYCCCRLFSAY